MDAIKEIDLDKLIEKIMIKVRDRMLQEIFKDIIVALKKLTEKITELAEAQRRTEERLDSLTRTVNELAEAQRRTEERLDSLIGEVATLRGEIIENRVVGDLGRILGKHGFDVYHAPRRIPYVDAIIETDGFLALVQVCKRCDLEDLRQIVRGARAFEELEDVRPNLLVIFSYTGEASSGVIEEAKKKGIIVEWNIRKLAKKLIKYAKK